MPDSPSQLRWKDKRGQAAVRDWRTWAFGVWVTVLVLTAGNVEQSAGWVGFVIVCAVGLAAQTVVMLLAKWWLRRHG